MQEMVVGLALSESKGIFAYFRRTLLSLMGMFIWPREIKSSVRLLGAWPQIVQE